MKTENLSVVPLRQASLCLDCEMITIAPTSCLACGSDALLSISRALSRSGRRFPPCQTSGPLPVDPEITLAENASSFARAGPLRSEGLSLALIQPDDVAPHDAHRDNGSRPLATESWEEFADGLSGNRSGVNMADFGSPQTI